jgi:hypothetical protein
MNLVVLGITPHQFYAQYALQQFLDIQTEPYHLVSFIQPKRMQKLFPTATIVDASTFIKADWPTSRDILKDLVKPYGKILFYFAPVTKGITPRNIENYQKRTFRNPRNGMTFQSSFKEYKKILFCLDSGLPVEHFPSDPLETNLSTFGVKEWFFYDYPGRSFHPYVEQMVALQPGPLEKTIDFTFGFSNVSRIPFRTELYNELKKQGVPFTYKGDEEDTLLPVPEYNRLLQHSRRTLIIPSYDTEHFSLIRYLEAEHRGCIPFIHKDCNIQYVEHKINKDYILKGDFYE